MKNVNLLIELTVDESRYRYGMSRIRIEMFGWGRTTIIDQWKELDRWNKFKSFKNGIHDYDKFDIQYTLRC